MRLTTVQIAILVGGALAALGTIGYFGVQSSRINAEKALKEAEIHEREALIHEQEETERTEERAQFWQKVVPWGRDEQEDSE